jgi:hypothetical protein
MTDQNKLEYEQMREITRRVIEEFNRLALANCRTMQFIKDFNGTAELTKRDLKPND